MNKKLVAFFYLSTIFIKTSAMFMRQNPKPIIIKKQYRTNETRYEGIVHSIGASEFDRVNKKTTHVTKDIVKGILHVEAYARGYSSAKAKATI